MQKKGIKIDMALLNDLQSELNAVLQKSASLQSDLSKIAQSISTGQSVIESILKKADEGKIKAKDLGIDTKQFDTIINAAKIRIKSFDLVKKSIVAQLSNL